VCVCVCARACACACVRVRACVCVCARARRKIQAGGPRVGDPWSKTKRLVTAMVCQLHFDIIQAIKNHILNGTHEPLMICALISVDVSLRAKKHTHHKHGSIISHYQGG